MRFFRAVNGWTASEGERCSRPPRAWSDSPTGDGRLFADGEEVSDLRDTPGIVVLYALWDDIVCTVSFDSAGGTEVADVRTHAGSIVAEPPVPEKPGYRFTGWFEDDARRVLWDFDSDRVVSDMMLHAGWADAPFAVSFDSRGGAPVPSAEVWGGSTVPEPDAPARRGYSLTGWFADAGLTDRWDFGRDRVVSDMTLYAGWEPVRYSIAYVLDGGADPGNPSWYTVESGAIALADPSRDGFLFCGWYADPGFSERIRCIPAGSTGDIVLHARWTADPAAEDDEAVAGMAIAIMLMAMASIVLYVRRR